MAKKEKVTLPAIGKPKPKVKKTPARALGNVANKSYLTGLSGQMTNKEAARWAEDRNKTNEVAGALAEIRRIRKIKNKAKPSYSKYDSVLAKRTGV